MTKSQEKVAVITGAASGIGAACVTYFGERGWRVVVNYFMEDERDRALALARACDGIAVQGDVSKNEDCRHIVEDAEAAFGRIDALICCAGTTRMVPHAELDRLDTQDFLNLTAVNTAGPFLMSRACAPLLGEADHAAIVIVSSYGALYGTGSSIAYAASKGAANTLTMSLARVLAPKIRVNAVCPALIADGFVQRLDPGLFQARAEHQNRTAPLQKVGKPVDVAGDIYWLATGASLMTGSVILLDCGLHLNGG